MTSPQTSDRPTPRPLAHTILPLGLVAIGAALMTYMIAVESEPGLLPLALVAAGVVWLVAARVRRR